MARKITESERLEQFFIAAPAGDAKLAFDRIALILRTRGVIVPQKRTRKPAKETKLREVGNG